MNTIRNILFYLFIGVTCIFFSTVSIVLSFLPVPFDWCFRTLVTWAKGLIWAAKFFIGARIKVIGQEYVDTEPKVYCSKHQSMFETMFFACYLPGEPCAAYKKSIHKIPFFGWAYSRLRHMPLDRSKPKEAMRQLMVLGKQRIEEGRSILIFPEGTRLPPGEVGRYQSGGARLAIETGVPIVAVAHNCAEIWPRHHWRLQKANLVFSFSPPFSPEGKTHVELMREVQDWIENEMKRLFPYQFEGDAAKTHYLSKAAFDAAKEAPVSVATDTSPLAAETEPTADESGVKVTPTAPVEATARVAASSIDTASVAFSNQSEFTQTTSTSVATAAFKAPLTDVSANQ